MRRTVFVVVLATLLVYLFWTDFGLLKKLVGYNVSKPSKPQTAVLPNEDDLSFLDIPEGLEISIIAKGLDKPRVIAFDSRARVLVSETKVGRVSVLEDKDGNGDFESRYVLIENLRSPHGLDFFKDPKTSSTYLYIAETHQVVRYSYDINIGKLISMVGQNIANLPADGRHFTRTIAFGPIFKADRILNGQIIYISVGSSCDACEEDTWKRAAILKSDPEGNYTAEFAGGLRNSVFFTFHPVTKEIWATEMGRDDLGDNLPPDEINIVQVAGSEHEFGARRYGWPFCYGNKVADTKFAPDKFERIDIPRNCIETESPAIELPAHSSPLGLAFIPSDPLTSLGQANGWPSQWQGDLLVAFHGSSNASKPVGYKIVRYDLDANGNILSQDPIDFIVGWLSENKKNVYGQPVDLKFDNNGNLYISDDAAGIIYKVSPK